MKRIYQILMAIFWRVVFLIYEIVGLCPRVLTLEETIQRALREKLSIARFGDGEIDLMNGLSISFQRFNPLLSKKLKEITQASGCLVCIPDIFSRRSFRIITNSSKAFWLGHKKKYFYNYLTIFGRGVYGNAHISRFYLRYADKRTVADTVKSLKQLWEGRDIVFIEGKESRLGVGNDLFDNSKGIRRILCPSINAFDRYDEILQYSLGLSVNTLYILALGPTATCLAADLAQRGRQALDLGHIDMEYEYYKRNVHEKVFIPGKFCNEAALNKGSSHAATVGVIQESDYEQYVKQIIKVFD